MKYAPINASASGSNTVVAAVLNKRIRVVHYLAIAAGDVTATWLSAATALSGPMAIPQNGGMAPASGVSSPAGIFGQFQTEAGEALNLSLSGAVSVGGHLTYIVTD